MKQKHSFCSTIFSFIFFTFSALFPGIAYAQKLEELNTQWHCKQMQKVPFSGEEISGNTKIDLSDWLPATIPGTVLTTLLNHNKVPDPFYGMNNEKIPDIYDTGRDHYTYWFYTEFEIEPKKGEEFWLMFRGINYSCEIYLNGDKVNLRTHSGMFLRQKYHISSSIQKGINKLAVLVYPPDPVGNPNGGQGGDGVIARNVMHQYVAGWDWIQPVRDRNTGIWDKVFLEKTGPVDVRNPHVITMVPGKRLPNEKQEPAHILVATELANTSRKSIRGNLIIRVDNQEVVHEMVLDPESIIQSEKYKITINDPELWWPSGYGNQILYNLDIQFHIDKSLSDQENVRFGIREIQTEWNPFTSSRQVSVNGQKIFIKGGNWIISDAMLRFSEERYDAEIRMHKDMNLNTIRIWGGAITERPEFYNACDKYGLLVMQDFWISGDCNGRWLDPRKKEDQWTRRKYPDDDQLFLTSAADQIKMIRNHPSLAFWCGGNELGPPEEILNPLKDTLTLLDGTRWFVDYSTSDSMSFNTLGGNGDGPYGIQNIDRFFEYKTFPFNSEVGSVGLPDYEGVKRYLPKEAEVIPGEYADNNESSNSRWSKIHPAWRYHKFMGYGNQIEKYGNAENLENYLLKAQLVNYNQYRGLIEGFSSHMWEWYTGVIIWKTQNPWTSMRGQMYDYYLDQNAGLYGLKSAGEPLHVFLDHTKNQVMIANNTFESQHDLMIEVNAYDMNGKKTVIYQEMVSILPTCSKRYGSIGRRLARLQKDAGIFLEMNLLNQNQKIVSKNFYWLTDESGAYSGLQGLKSVGLNAKVIKRNSNVIELLLANPSQNNPVSFFNRISVIDSQSGERVLPVFYSDNYVSLLPGTEDSIIIDLGAIEKNSGLAVKIQGWNTKTLEVKLD